MTQPFNSPLETGVRSVALLVAAFPESLDIQRLVDFDYLVVHSGDAGGPASLHPPLPHRTGELLVRRELIERGLLLMMSRGLINRIPTTTGIFYSASENAGPFLSFLTTPYIQDLRQRSHWVVDKFGQASDAELNELTRKFFKQWTTQFQYSEQPGGNST